MYACVFLFTFLLAIPYTSASDLTPTQNPEAKLVIFDEIGTLLSTTAFIHVTIPLNLTQLQVQATSIMLYLNQIRHTNSSIADDLPKFKKNLDDICFNAAKKLNRVMGKIRLLDSILPADTENFRSFMDMQELKLKQRQQQQQQQQQQPLHPTLHKRRRKRLTKNERPYVPDWRLFDTLRDIIMDSNELLIKPIKRTRNKRLVFMGLYIDAELKRQQLAIDKSNLTDQLSNVTFHRDELLIELAVLRQKLHDLTFTPDIPNMNEIFSTNMENLNHFQQKSGTNIEQHFANRNKRAAIALPVVGILTGIVGTFLGFFNQAEINTLKERVSDIENKHNILVSVTNDHEILLQNLAKSMEHLTHFVDTLTRHNPTVLAAYINEEIDFLYEQTMSALAVIQQLQNRKLAIDFLTKEQLTYLHQTLLERAKDNDYTLMPQYLNDYYQLETSYIRHKNDITILIHVPCYVPENRLTIYRFVPFPFPLPLKTHFSSMSIENKLYFDEMKSESNLFPLVTEIDPHTEALFINPENKFLAIGRDNKFKVFDGEEMAMCTKRGKTYLCDNNQVTRKDMEQSCLGSLYLRHEKGVFRHCKFKREILREKVYQLSATDHLVFTPTPLTAQVKCNNGTHHPLFLSQNTRVHIPQGCSTELRDHTIKSVFNIRLTPEPLKILWHFDPLKLPSDLLEDVGQTDQRLVALHRQMRKVEDYMEPEKAAERLAHLAQSQIVRVTSLPWYIWATIIISLLSFLLIIGYCIFRKCFPKNRPHHIAIPPNYAMQHNVPPPNDQTPTYCFHGRPIGICCAKP